MFHRERLRPLLLGLLALSWLTLTTTRGWAITVIPSWEPPEDIASSVGIDHVDGQDRFLDFDHFGIAGLTQTDNGPFAGRVQFWRRNVVSGWREQTVFSAAPIANVDPPIHSSFVFDRSERPVVAAVEDDGDNLRVSQLDETGFFFDSERVFDDVTVDDNAGTSVAIDPIGRIGVAFVTGDAPRIRYALDIDGNGSFDDSATGNPFTLGVRLGTRPSLAFDPQARPMIGFIGGSDFAGTTDRVVVADADIGTPFGISLPDPDVRSSFVSLAVNPQTGNPAVAYNDLRGNQLKYAEFDGEGWNAESVDTQGLGTSSADMSVSLAFDPADGLPAIAYTKDTVGDDATENVLAFAWDDGASWNTQTVDDREGIAAGAVSLAFNEAFAGGFGDGLPAIAYVDELGFYRYIHDPPAELGDFNGDGVVNALDYTTFRNGYGTTYGSGDYEAWISNYGAVAASAATSGSAASVPEPTGLTFMLILVLGMLPSVWRSPRS